MEILRIEQIEKQFPNEWVLIGNPIIQDTKILKGEVLFHSKDKKEVCYLGLDTAATHTTIDSNALYTQTKMVFT